ncbi:MAG TPA: hypothetical protein VGW33_00515 [Terriglobia bacterium]|nr:hypothetical protein [Terriglobia bacterium]
MTLNQKSAFGMGLLVFGFVWFVFDVFQMPPGLIILCGFGSRCPDLVGQYFGILWQAEFLLSATTVAAGVLVRCSASRKLPRKAYFIAFGSAGLAALAVFWLYGWFPFSK